MAHGGARPGAGKPKGATSKVLQEARERAAAGGLMPLDYLLEVMRKTDNDEAKRIDCAKAAAPYLHPKLANLTVGGDAEKPFKMVIEWENVTE